ncbi:MAG: hypothetical protein JST14_06855, partial [Bacteroidetes bacterium]|nr:hypothetical protein [Bacteroidota bacterium]
VRIQASSDCQRIAISAGDIVPEKGPQFIDVALVQATVYLVGIDFQLGLMMGQL